ncbi:Auxin-responsive protein SAUR66 [Linum grandiflorum]
MTINPMKLIKMAKKWRNQVATKKKNMIPTLPQLLTSRSFSKGHFAVYTMEDQKRFMVPICCLDSQAFRELLEISEEEFGPPGSGPIRLPCDGPSVECLVSLIRRAADDGDLFKAVITCVYNGRRIASSCSPLDYSLERSNSSQQRLVISGF